MRATAFQPPRVDDAITARGRRAELALYVWSRSAMKETPLSNCERRFLLRAIQERKVRCQILLLVPCPGPFPPQLQGSAAPRCGRIRPGVVQ